MSSQANVSSNEADSADHCDPMAVLLSEDGSPLPRPRFKVPPRRPGANLASAFVGARVVGVSSEVPGCEAENVLYDSAALLWLSKESEEKHWIVVRLEASGVWPSLGLGRAVVQSVGWHCCQAYSTNPLVVRVEVSADSTKWHQLASIRASKDSGLELVDVPHFDVGTEPLVRFTVDATVGAASQCYLDALYCSAEPASVARPQIEATLAAPSKASSPAPVRGNVASPEKKKEETSSLAKKISALKKSDDRLEELFKELEDSEKKKQADAGPPTSPQPQPRQQRATSPPPPRTTTPQRTMARPSSATSPRSPIAARPPWGSNKRQQADIASPPRSPSATSPRSPSATRPPWGSNIKRQQADSTTSPRPASAGSRRQQADIATSPRSPSASSRKQQADIAPSPRPSSASMRQQADVHAPSPRSSRRRRSPLMEEKRPSRRRDDDDDYDEVPAALLRRSPLLEEKQRPTRRNDVAAASPAVVVRREEEESSDEDINAALAVERRLRLAAEDRARRECEARMALEQRAADEERLQRREARLTRAADEETQARRRREEEDNRRARKSDTQMGWRELAKAEDSLRSRRRAAETERIHLAKMERQTDRGRESRARAELERDNRIVGEPAKRQRDMEEAKYWARRKQEEAADYAAWVAKTRAERETRNSRHDRSTRAANNKTHPQHHHHHQLPKKNNSLPPRTTREDHASCSSDSSRTTDDDDEDEEQAILKELLEDATRRCRRTKKADDRHAPRQKADDRHAPRQLGELGEHDLVRHVLESALHSKLAERSSKKAQLRLLNLVNNNSPDLLLKEEDEK